MPPASNVDFNGSPKNNELSAMPVMGTRNANIDSVPAAWRFSSSAQTMKQMPATTSALIGDRGNGLPRDPAVNRRLADCGDREKERYGPCHLPYDGARRLDVLHQPASVDLAYAEQQRGEDQQRVAC